jgi:hypothetical protein
MVGNCQIVVPTQTLAHSFCHNEVKYFDYVHQSEPTTTLLDFMNVLADIVSTFNDHSAENFTPSHDGDGNFLHDGRIALERNGTIRPADGRIAPVLYFRPTDE